MTIRAKSVLIDNINNNLADNNAGLISAADVRNNMVDIVDSINQIVASGNFNADTPFVNTVKLQIVSGSGGILIAESGIRFGVGGSSELQTQPFLGVAGINHNQLGNLTAGDPHTQYILASGARVFSGNLGLSNNWINSSGSRVASESNGRGLQFVYKSSSEEHVNVGSGTSIKFLKDESIITSARGVAKAWINFDASGVNHIPTVKDSYGVSGLYKHEVGKFTITFNSGVFKDNNYVAFGYSNATSTSGSKEDFINNTVGLVSRAGNDGTSLRTLTFVVRDEGGQYIDSELNHLVVFGTEPNGSGQPPVVVTVA
jgi:hypothetical protein